MAHFRLRFAWLWPLGLMLGCAQGQTTAATVPQQLQGQWVVVQVAVDHSDQPHWLYSPNDPRLLGRLLTIGSTGVVLNDDSPACASPTYTIEPSESLQHFIGKNYRRPPAFQVPPLPTLDDFDLHLRDVAVSPLQIHCTPAASSWATTWFVLTADRLLVGEADSSHLLVLQRVDPQTPIRASFDCAKAGSVVERAICGSRALAAYDRSVAAAYRLALRNAGDDSAAVRQDQRKWLETRDACGGDAACLVQSMRERVDELMQQ